MSETNKHDEICHRSHTIGPTKFYRLKSDLDREKKRQEDADADTAFMV